MPCLGLSNLSKKKCPDPDLIEISALELAKIMGNAEIIQSLQDKPLSTNGHIFWNKIRTSALSRDYKDPADIILEYSEDTTVKVKKEIGRALGKS